MPVSPPALRESALTPQPHIGVGAFDLAQEENVMKKISMIGATLVGAAVLCAAPISLHQSLDKGLSLSVDKAQARIGRPLTPGSVAGVHRRVERRAYRGGSYGQGSYGHGGSQAAAGTPCKEAAKLEFPSDRKARHDFKKSCKAAWKATQKAPQA